MWRKRSTWKTLHKKKSEDNGEQPNKDKARKPHKYLAEKTTVDGIEFASKAEARRYRVLKQREAAGIIAGLELQPKYLLQEKFRYAGKAVRAIEYTADFRYLDVAAHAVVVEDVKGMPTPLYQLKKKLFLRLHAIPSKIIFREIKKPTE
jgi:hypothetical protein